MTIKAGRWAAAVGAVIVLQAGGPAAAYSPAAAAGGPLCQGSPATIVGVTGDNLMGTDGPDVIVTNGASEVYAKGGNDLICVNNVVGSGVDDSVLVAAGAGDDVIDTTGNVGVGTFAHLDAGDDHFVGGSERDLVEAVGYRDQPDPADGVDTVSTGGGPDLVRTGGTTALPDGDDINLGPGRDEIEIQGAVDGVTYAGGANSDLITIDRLPVASWAFDNASGQAVRDDGIAISWTAFERFNFYGGQTSQVSFKGGAGPEFVRSLIAFDMATLGGGDDTIEVWPDELADDTAMRVFGQAGTDYLRLGRRYNDGAVDLNLGTGRLRFMRPTKPGETGVVGGFERTDVYAFWARVVGTSGADTIGWDACHGSVAGGAGNDDLTFISVIESSCGYFGDAADIPIRGGAGNDRLVGGMMPDVLLGGRGNDTADGKGNEDVCRAESTMHCEQH